MLRTEIRVVLPISRWHSQDSQKHLCSTDMLIIWSSLNSNTDSQISSGPVWFLFCFSHNILYFHGRGSIFISIFLSHVLVFCSLPTSILSGWLYFAFSPAPKRRCAAVAAPITTSQLKTVCACAYGERGGRMLRFLYKAGTFLLQVPPKWYIPKANLEYHFKMHQVENVVDNHLQFAQHTNNAVLATPFPLTGCTNRHVSTVHTSEVSVWSNKFLSWSSKLYLSPWQSSWMFLLIH